MTARSPYPAWTTDSGTCEIPSARRGLPLEDLPTTVIDFYLKPDLGPVALTTPRPRRLRRLLAALGVTGLIAGLLLAEMAVTALVPVAGIR